MASQVDVLLLALGDVRQDARTLNLARALRKAGYRVGVVAGGILDNVEMYTWMDPGGRALSRWLSFTLFVRSLHVRAHIVIGMDLFALKGAAYLARLCDANLWYDMREFYFSLGPLGGKGVKQTLIAYHERRLLKRVDRVLVSGYLDAAVVQKKFNLPKPPHILLNTPPYSVRVPSDYLRRVFEIPSNKIVVLYQGVVHHGRGIKPFMLAMKHLENVVLCVVGEGPALPELQVHATECGVAGRVYWHKSVPYDELHAITCSADVGLCLIEPVSESYRYALPNKLFEYMMAGVPVLATDLPALHEQLVRIPSGVLVHQELQAAQITDALDRLLVPATYDAMKEAATRVRGVAYDVQAQGVINLVKAVV